MENRSSRGTSAPDGVLDHQFKLDHVLENITVAQVRDEFLKTPIGKKSTVLGIYVGDRQLDATENGCSELMKNIPELAKDRAFIIRAKHHTTHSVFEDVVAGATFGAAVAPTLVTSLVGALGFAETGITAGTFASSLMASYQGSVAAGSLCAVLQSIGAAGLGFGGLAVVGCAGALVAGAGVICWNLIRRSQSSSNK